MLYAVVTHHKILYGRVLNPNEQGALIGINDFIIVEII